MLHIPTYVYVLRTLPLYLPSTPRTYYMLYLHLRHTLPPHTLPLNPYTSPPLHKHIICYILETTILIRLICLEYAERNISRVKLI